MECITIQIRSIIIVQAGTYSAQYVRTLCPCSVQFIQISKFSGDAGWATCLEALKCSVRHTVHHIEMQRVWPSTVSWNASQKLQSTSEGLLLVSRIWQTRQIYDRKGVFFAIVDNMSNLIDQTNPLTYSAMKHVTEAFQRVYCSHYVAYCYDGTGWGGRYLSQCWQYI